MAAAGDEKSFAKRDKLLKIEAQVKTWWDDGDVFRVDCGEKPPEKGEKFFGNFPFPYMNGHLHLGHAFSLSKVEFAAAYHRLKGANVLLPFGFHCTGMPIKASADKLAREISQFGYPPVFPKQVEEEQLAQEDANGGALRGKFKGKKSKAATKCGGQMYQWDIMRSFRLSDSELPDIEISEFQNPEKWLKYFPPLAKEHLKAFGLGCDWRRSFVTTEANPFFDSFVKWQMRKLKSMGKIVKDVRYTIYSPMDRQPCADHDRATGEGVQPQEYTLIKMEVLPQNLPTKSAQKFVALEGRNVYLAAATLRPETLYGQTNAWVLPEGRYGAYEVNENDVFIITERAALNLAYQNFSRIPEKPTCLVELTGYDLIGVSLRSPLSFNEVIYVLPMLNILTDKGTGIVTSVPSDSPDDYMALRDLKDKPDLKTKFGVKDEWIPSEIIPVINIQDFGDKPAEKVCKDMEIKSQNEKGKLAEAKRLTYLKGFTEGTMLVGEYTGRKVQEAKPLIRNKLVETGEAVRYWEPEKKVMSRSGDECVVACTAQWYITYGETEWKKMAEDCLNNMNLYSDEARHGFERTLSWLNQWACSRSSGLGTCIPWDPDFLVESLSDSTMYMAYYTIAHILHPGDMYGKTSGAVEPGQMTDEVWDFIFCGGPYPESSDIPLSTLKKMKQEFEYWYPFDLRVSGKDLIQNHLTFCIYNHTAIMAKRHWPGGFRCNGHIMLNKQKMSKSTGNFRTLKQAIEEFSADATRFSLADAGDGVDDANFEFKTANSAVLRLTREIEWMEKILRAESSLRTGPLSTFADRVFDNEINFAVKMTEQHYDNYMFREALKSGFYDLQAAKEEYKKSCGGLEGMNGVLVRRFMDVQTRLITPICPHYGEYVWRQLLKKDGFAVKAGWPEADTPDLTLKSAYRYLQDTIGSMRELLEKKIHGSKKGNKKAAPVMALVYVKEEFEGWKAELLKILQEKFNSKARTFAPENEILEALVQTCSVGQIQDANFKQTQKKFFKSKVKEAIEIGPQALDLKLTFGENREIDVLKQNVELIKRQLKNFGLEEVEILSATNRAHRDRAGSLASLLDQNPPSPGNPIAIFVTKPDWHIYVVGFLVFLVLCILFIWCS